VTAPAPHLYVSPSYKQARKTVLISIKAVMVGIDFNVEHTWLFISHSMITRAFQYAGAPNTHHMHWLVLLGITIYASRMTVQAFQLN